MTELERLTDVLTDRQLAALICELAEALDRRQNAAALAGLIDDGILECDGPIDDPDTRVWPKGWRGNDDQTR